MVGQPLLPEPDPEAVAALRASIEEFGVLEPVIYDLEGRLLDGYTRRRLAKELRKPCPKITLPCASEDERLRITLGANLGRRHLTRTQRDELIERLFEHGWSNRTIAGVLGVNESTIRRSAPAANAALAGRQVRLTDREVSRRRRAVRELWDAGYRRDKIAEALGVGEGTVSRDARVMGLVRGPGRYRHRAGDVPPIPWRDTDPPAPAPAPRKRTKVERMPPPAPAPEPQPLYRQSTTIAQVTATRQNLFRDNAENRLAHDAQDAEKANDAQWFTWARDEIRQLHEALSRLQRVLDDPEQRRASQASINEMPDDGQSDRPRLRAV